MTPQLHAFLLSLAVALVGIGLLISHPTATRVCIALGTILAGVVLVNDALQLA
ncbi:hypothetical protein [Amycolatopsis thermoflava]|uniref:hypothetical protein n=1 Tax=Amycolatopsis thermoflava TaxID=84480 RepID=UPI0003F78E27|nr:hypothetical protein [Amycolatopsis thermoflava]